MEAPSTDRVRLDLRGPALAILIVGVIGGLLLIVTEFSTIASVELENSSCEVIEDNNLADRCELSGFERHGGSFLLLGLAAIAMSFGVAHGRSRPAAVALLAIAAIVAVFAFVGDIPEADKTGAIGPDYEGAEGKTGIGITLELAGAALCALAGLLGLLRPAREDAG